MEKSQIRDVLDYLINHEDGITQIQATNLFGATRLSSIIYELRRYGLNIDTVMESCKNRYGKTVRYGRYVLRDKVINHVVRDGIELNGDDALKWLAVIFNRTFDELKNGSIRSIVIDGEEYKLMIK